MINKTLSLSLMLIIFSVVLSACNFTNLLETTPSPSPSPTALTSPIATTSKKQTNYEFTATASGQLAIDLLQSQAQIEATDYGTAGKFVISINDLASNKDYYWAFYVNGQYAEQGISQTQLKKGDSIKFVYEAVTPTN